MPTVMEVIQDTIAPWAGMSKEDARSKITPKTVLGDSGLKLDSLDQVEALMEIEDALGIKIGDDDQGEILTVQNLLDVIKRENDQLNPSTVVEVKSKT